MQKTTILKVFLHLVFFLSGIATVLIGQVLPILATHFALNDLQVSYFFPAQFAGSLCGTSLTSRFARRNNYMAAAIQGGVAMAAGVLLMNVDSFVVCLVGFLVNGIGIGLTLPAINMMVLELNPERPAAALSVVNFCWGLGAIVCKPFVDLCSTGDNIGPTTLILAAPLLGSSILLLSTVRSPKTLPAADIAGSAGDHTPIWSMPIAWAIALFNFIHVGFESGMGGWLTTYTGRLEGQPFLPWISPTLLYFSLFVIGRGVAPVFFRYLSENKMLMLGLIVVLAGVILTLSAGSVAVLSIGSAVAGFGTSWIFPTNVSRFSKTFGPAAQARATPLFISGTVGAAAVTWLIGFLSNRTGNLRYGMYVLAISVLLLIVLQIGLALKRPEA